MTGILPIAQNYSSGLQAPARSSSMAPGLAWRLRSREHLHNRMRGTALVGKMRRVRWGDEEARIGASTGWRLKSRLEGPPGCEVRLRGLGPGERWRP
jgi:hypothetical protein